MRGHPSLSAKTDHAIPTPRPHFAPRLISAQLDRLSKEKLFPNIIDLAMNDTLRSGTALTRSRSSENSSLAGTEGRGCSSPKTIVSQID